MVKTCQHRQPEHVRDLRVRTHQTEAPAEAFGRSCGRGPALARRRCRGRHGPQVHQEVLEASPVVDLDLVLELFGRTAGDECSCGESSSCVFRSLRMRHLHGMITKRSRCGVRSPKCGVRSPSGVRSAKPARSVRLRRPRRTTRTDEIAAALARVRQSDELRNGPAPHFVLLDGSGSTLARGLGCLSAAARLPFTPIPALAETSPRRRPTPRRPRRGSPRKVLQPGTGDTKPEPRRTW